MADFKNVEHALRETEDRYRLLADHVSDVIFTLDLNLRYTYCSPSVERLRGYTVEEAMAQTPAEVMTPASYQLAAKTLEDEIARERAAPGASDASKTLELELMCKGGGTVWAEVNVSFLRDEQGRAVGILGASRDITRRRQFEDLLQKERDTFYSVLNKAPYGIVLFGRDGRSLYANRAFTDITRYSLEDIPTAKDWLRKAFPEDAYRRHVRAVWRIDVQAGEMTRTLAVRCRDQTVKEIEFKSAMLDEGRAISMLSDVTQHRRDQEALRKSEETYRTMFETTGTSAVIIEESGVICLANAEFEKLSGYAKEEVENKKTWTEFVTPPHLEEMQAHHRMRRIDPERAPRSYEFQLIDREGKVKDVLATVSVFPGTAGRSMASLLDITDRKRVEEALRASQERLRSIVDNISIGITLIGPGMEVLSMNNQMRAWFPRVDLSSNRLCYEAFNDPPGTEVCAYCPTFKTLQDGRVHESITETPVGGEIRNYRIISTPLKDNEGATIAAIGMVDDITERRRALKEIQRLNEELEQRVVERTAALEAANKELEAFSYSVSHDLRMPLIAIEGFSSRLAERYAEGLADEGQRFLQIIGKNAKRMQQLIDDLLAFSRLGHERLELAPVDMTEMAESVFWELKQAATGRSIEFIPRKLPACRADGVMLRQVFVNLISNAIKFTQRREDATVEVGGWLEEEQGVYFVRDNGVGFDMQQVNKLFQVFQRLHAEEEFGGTGLGLSIVERIIGRHGGKVWAEGKPGTGATFYFTIPRAERM